MKRLTLAAVFGLSLLPLAGGTAIATVSVPPAQNRVDAPVAIERVQYSRLRGGYVAGPRGGYVAGPRFYAAPRYVPGRAYFAPRGYSGRPYWFARPWNVRPYYGTIIGGVALGTLITVAAIGYVPPRPAPNLCWYWADPDGEQGYWDYCS